MSDDEILTANEAQLLGAMGLTEPVQDYVAYAGSRLADGTTNLHPAKKSSKRSKRFPTLRL